MKQQLTITELKKEIRRLDPKLKTTDPAFTTAVILMASAIVGADARAISKYSAIPLSEVTKRSKNFRKQKVWVGEKVRHSGWFDKETGGIAFWLDVAIGQGYLARSA